MPENKMRIAILSNVADERGGGAGRIAAVEADLLRERGHEVKTWTAGDRYAPLPKLNLFSRVMFHVRDLSPRRELVEEIFSWRPDVLITHNLTACGFGTPRALKQKKIHWVATLHDVQLIEPSGQIVDGESLPFLRNIWRHGWSSLRHHAMGEPDAVISPTKWLLDFHQSYGWFRTCQTAIIPNPIRLSRENGNPGSIGMTKKKQVAYAGRLDVDKGIDLLLAAWKKIADPSARLVVVGDGSQRKELEAMHDPSIDVRGALPNDDVQKIFSESSVVVVPSRVWENQPTVILEALAAECHVVAADVGGVRETLGDAGTIVPPNDVDALAQAMKGALSIPRTPEQASAAKKILALHDPRHFVEELEMVLRSNLKT